MTVEISHVVAVSSYDLSKITESQSPQTVTYGPYLHAFANKDLLEHSNAHSFVHCLWLLSLYNGRVETHERHHVPDSLCMTNTPMQ